MKIGLIFWVIKILKSKYEVVNSPGIAIFNPDNLFSLINHKHELHLLNADKDTIKRIDISKHSPLSCNWSPCGKFIAYSCSLKMNCRIIKIYDLKNKSKHIVTDAVSSDFSPIFDPSGKYLAFLSNRNFNPVYDNIQFDLGFPITDKPYLIMLNKSTPSPFIKNPNFDDNANKKNNKTFIH